MAVENWYEYASNYSNGTIVDSIGKAVFKYPAFILGNWLAYGILILIWLMVFIATAVSGSRKALLTSSFATFIFSVYFVRLDMINPVVVVMLIIATILGAIGAKEERGL